MGKRIKKKHSIFTSGLSLLLFLSITMNAQAASISTNSESNQAQITSHRQEQGSQDNDSNEIKEGQTEQNEISSNNSDSVNPSSENKVTMEKSIFKVKSIDQKLLDLENELLQLRKKAVEQQSNLSIAISMRYFELNNENMLIHDFKENYFKGEESKYEQLMNTYYKSKEQQFNNLIQKYQDAIILYSKALNVPVNEKLLKASMDRSVLLPMLEDIQIRKTVVSDEQVISVKVTVYHVEEDELINENERDEADKDQSEQSTDELTNEDQTDKAEKDQPEDTTDELINENVTEEADKDQSEDSFDELTNESMTEDVKDEHNESVNNELDNESVADKVNDDQLPLIKTLIHQQEYNDIRSGESLDISVKRDVSITKGYYLVELKYSDPKIPTEYLKYSTVTEALTSTAALASSNMTINTNQSIDVSLGAGISQVYEFTATKTKSHRVFTGPYGGVGGDNDTVLEIYSDAALTNLIASNDDYNGTAFSSTTFVPNAGQKYYIKLRTYSSSDSLNCRITVLLPEPIVFTETSAQYVYNTSGSLAYISYGSGRLLVYVYDNNGNLTRKVMIN